MPTDASPPSSPSSPTALPSRRVIIVGAGVFGVSTALALRRRYLRLHSTSPHSPHLYSSIFLLDSSSSPLPSPLSASSDLNRIVRADYADSSLYTTLALTSIQRWHELNARWREDVYHETGLILLTSSPLPSHPYESASFALLSSLGLPLTRLTPAVMADRFPLHAASGHYTDGYFNPRAGWVDNHRAMQLLLRDAEEEGVTVLPSTRVVRVVGGRAGGRRGEKVARGVECEGGKVWDADLVIFCCGAWTPALLPATAPLLRASPQPVVYLQPPAHLLPLLSTPSFPVCAADLAHSGFYLFPPSTRSLPYPSSTPSTTPSPSPSSTTAFTPVIKVAHHGPGLPYDDPSSPLRIPPPHLTSHLTSHIHRTLPILSLCPPIHSRLCYYCDTFDGHFLIDFLPPPALDAEGAAGECGDACYSNVLVVGGDSGHAFKFAPVLGDVVVGVLTRDEGYREARETFRWRLPPKGAVDVLDACRAPALNVTADGGVS